MRNEVRETSVDVTGRDAVDTGKVPPFVGKRLGQVNAASLSDVVGSLLLRIVGNVSRHGGGENEAAGLAFSEVQPNGPGAVEGTCKIGVDDLVPLLDGSIQNAIVGSFASVGDEDVDLPEIIDDVLNQLLDVGVVADETLVWFASDAVLFAQLLRVLLSSLRARGICDCNVCSHLSTTPGGFDTNASWSGRASHDDDLALQAEQVLKTVGLWDWDRHDERFVRV